MARLTDQDTELLSAYLDGALSTAERSALDTRLQAEPELRRELDTLRGTVNLIRALPPIKAPRDYALDERQIRPARLWIFPVSAVSAISAAAATLLLVLGAITLLSSGAPQESPSAALIAVQATSLSTISPDSVDNTAASLPPLTLEGFSANDAQLNKMDATLTTMSESQEAGGAMQRQTAPDALAVPAMPQPQGSPPPSIVMGGAAQPTGTAELYYGEEEVPSELTGAADAIAMQAAQPTMTAMLPPTSTATPSETPSATATPQPTLTLTPTPVPVFAAPAGTSPVGIVMVLGGVALLLVAIVTSLLRRRGQP